MSLPTADLLTPRILVVDDERQIHASLRLRLGRDYDLVYCFDGRSALERLQQHRFDLCFADIHMPQMDGLTFIELARQADPALGFVVLSAFDTDENLRRAIPLQVYDFVPKPLPEKNEFEARIPEWISRTRQKRQEQELARQAGTIASDRDSALLEREVELIASETARDALLQTANLLTTIHAHLVSATTLVAARVKTDPSAGQLLRNLDEARKTADAAVTVAAGFFDSAYGNRDSSAALINEGIRHAIGIATRLSRAAEHNKATDFSPLDDRLPIRGLSGIDFLLLMVPAVGAALTFAPANTTVGIRGEHVPRLDAVTKDSRLRDYFWINRRNALHSHPAVLLTLAATARPFTRATIEAWLKGDHGPLAAISPRGLVTGIQKCHGLFGVSLDPHADQFRLLLALPI